MNDSLLHVGNSYVLKHTINGIYIDMAVNDNLLVRIVFLNNVLLCLWALFASCFGKPHLMMKQAAMICGQMMVNRWDLTRQSFLFALKGRLQGAVWRYRTRDHTPWDVVCLTLYSCAPLMWHEDARHCASDTVLLAVWLAVCMGVGLYGQWQAITAWCLYNS